MNINKFMSKSPLECIEGWFLAQCDGDWEHNYGFKIETTDNPGWYVEVDLSETELQDTVIPFVRDEISESEWIQFEVREEKFCGSGGVLNLNKILLQFLSIIRQESRHGK